MICEMVWRSLKVQVRGDRGGPAIPGQGATLTEIMSEELGCNIARIISARFQGEGERHITAVEIEMPRRQIVPPKIRYNRAFDRRANQKPMAAKKSPRAAGNTYWVINMMFT
jgi:hypothetical protein